MVNTKTTVGFSSLHQKTLRVCFNKFKNGHIQACRTRPFTASEKRQHERFRRVAAKANEVMRNPEVMEVLRPLFYKKRRKYKQLRTYVFYLVNELCPK